MAFWTALALGLIVGAGAAAAADCPGNPNAIGTSRTLVVDPRAHPRIGTMQYPETLPLEDHEVVLSFDDGPLPRNSNQVLAILASQCVKATFFLVGQMAHTFPDGVRKLRDAGHTIGTHSQNHPLTMNRMPIERAKAEIDDGIASVKAALGPGADKVVAPFFRIPGLERATAVEDYLASQGIQTWSADFPADDWKHISSQRVYDLAIQRIEAKGRGILLLHDIQARTVAALPRILETLKARGYRIVHVVPATPDLPATPTEPQQWQLHPRLETVATSHWPKVPAFVFTHARMLAAPSPSDFQGPQASWMPPPQPSRWPDHVSLSAATPTTVLPIASPTVFAIQEMPHPNPQAVALLAPPAPRTSAVNSGVSRRAVGVKPMFGRSKRSKAASRAASRESALAAPAQRGLIARLV